MKGTQSFQELDKTQSKWTTFIVVVHLKETVNSSIRDYSNTPMAKYQYFTKMIKKKGKTIK